MINKQDPWIVPSGIKYLMDWSDFCLPNHQCIIDKKLTGCGFTEFVIQSSFNAILVSPRRVLLENKAEQHNPSVTIDGERKEIPDQRNLYYAKCDWEEDLQIDKNLEIDKETEVYEVPEEEKKSKYEIFRYNLLQAVSLFQLQNKPIKICVTYDSFRKVKEILKELGIYETFFVVVDEFQSIFSDGTFKPNTELEFVSALQDTQKVSYVSATPMIEDYLNMIPEFDNLPYYELDWYTAENSRLKIPSLLVNECYRINKVFKDYIDEYRSGIFAKKVISINGISQVVESRELVFYVNSVKNICDAIRQNKLTPSEVDVICSNTKENREKVREAFRYSLRYLYGDNYKQYLPDLKKIISKVPTPDSKTGISNNKPFTFCTKTVYLGADMYSKCARTIVVSDSGIECLAVDITLDLPQIMGRQRDEENPWKYEAEIWVKFGMRSGKISPEQFEARLQDKMKATDDLLSVWGKGTDSERHRLAKVYLDRANTKNYKEDFVSVNTHAGSDLKPQKNNIVFVSEKRAYDIQQKDYASRFAMFNRIEQVFGEGSTNETLDILNNLDQYTQFSDKMKRCCWYVNNGYSIDSIPSQFKTYIQILGTEFILSKSGRKSLLDEAINSRETSRVFTQDDLEEVVVKYFEESGVNRWSKSDLKQVLGEIYKSLGITKTPKASDIQNWFNTKRISILGDSGKRIDGFEIIPKK